MIRFAAQLVCDGCRATFALGAFGKDRGISDLYLAARRAGWKVEGLRHWCPGCSPAKDAGARGRKGDQAANRTRA